jgi:hypothetical protein
VEEIGSLTRFTPHGVKWVIFLMEYKLIYLEPTACFFVLNVDIAWSKMSHANFKLPPKMISEIIRA